MKNAVKVIPLGGLGSIGKNITVIEYEEEIIVIDCGMGFPDEQMYGVDLVIPDITYLLQNKNKVKGIFFTHGHEDHIGAVPYILKQMNIPLYGTPLTLGIIENKLQEHGLLTKSECHCVEAGDVIALEQIKVEFVRSTHSIAGACCIAVHTPEGIIFHTGDFKVDYTPVDQKGMDLQRIGELGKEGILLLLADSTNVERKGHSPSEVTIGKTLERLFDNVKGRIIVATFASNIHRIQQIINAAVLYGRKVAFSGRSMENITKVASSLGYLNIPEATLIEGEQIKNYSNDQITIVTTGSQGEPMAALARIAFGKHRSIQIEPNDLFIISASPIPGNDKLVSKVINELYKKGAQVIYKDLEEVHVSGHAYKEELKLMHTLTHPQYFMPVHGEYRHLIHHRNLARQMGMPHDHIFILEDGDVLEVNKVTAGVIGRVRAGNILVDGIGIGDVGNIVLRDRKHLAEEGMLIVVAAIDLETYSIMSGPDIITRGFVYAKDSEDLIEEVKAVANKELEMCLAYQMTEWHILKTSIKKVVEQLLYEKTKRRPTILPIIMEV
ncbi:ribonuclease J [Cellulosilyticum lentocellum]|uniref:Ribonuclease J n=1 Tax=Cellulosilyticum lentocellum (strain ATCC 49066 / DSM 5427 / NCIMB 11756 / RHM5) TaxID=642492 RepID=F2JN90_CELLD|nr:ribonuclease J [Cellulosilyticum lentocellum]ADZ83544.1 Ribocuclease J [Cellulosilyticum lentocellum DSM 5427]